MFQHITQLLQLPWANAIVIAVAGIVAAFFAEVVIARMVTKLTARTKTQVDDMIVELLRRPIFYTVLFGGVAWALEVVSKPDPTQWYLPADAKFVVFGVLKTVLIMIWVFSVMRIGSLILRSFSANGTGLVQPRTLPLFEIAVKLTILSLGGYFLLVAWKINASGWLASAGVFGIIIGLAAKDTLGNLFAGLFILADAPYKLGDFIVLDGGLRGSVTDIGFRSTRILTRDDIEITVPNSLIGASKIVNETAGPDKTRHRIIVDAAYGSDIDLVRKVLLECPVGAAHVCTAPSPRVRFREFGGSGLVFQLLFWIDDPARRGEVVDNLNCRVYKAFAAANIEIPYSKHDVYIKEMPKGS